MKDRPNLYTPLLFMAVMILVGFSSRLILWLGGLSSDLYLSTAIIQLLVFLLPMAFYAVIRGSRFSSVLKFNGFAVRKLPFVALMTLLMLASIMFFRYLGLFWFRRVMTDTPSVVYLGARTDSTVLRILCDVLLPAVLEELICRGILLEEYRRYGNGFAVCMSAAMFAMLHVTAGNLFYFFCLGLIYGAVTVVCDSLIPALAMHALCNLSYFYLRRGTIEYVRQAGKSPLLPYILFALILLLLFFVFARMESLSRDESLDELTQSRKELLRMELEKNKPAEEKPKKTFFPYFRDVWLSPTFLAASAVYVLFAARIL